MTTAWLQRKSKRLASYESLSFLEERGGHAGRVLDEILLVRYLQGALIGEA